MYKSAGDMTSALHWNGGQNNLLWESHCFFHSDRCDAPFTTFHSERAALASGSLTRAHMRLGYDLTIPLPRPWGRSGIVQAIHRPRTWLLTFRGSIQNSMHPYYQHRWLAAEYWEDTPDVLVDVQCKRRKLVGGEKVVIKPYSLPASSYDDMMWNSTFGFAPGGSSVGSYRFAEILSTGGIPVVTQDFVAPFHPEIDWSECIVRVSEARIIDLPRILRQYSGTEVKQKQRTCWQLFQNVIGDKQDGTVWRGDRRVAFTKAMEVWSLRIASAMERKKRIDSLTSNMVG